MLGLCAHGDGIASNNSGARRTVVLSALGLAAIAVYLACTPTGGWDVWWHLETGRLALEEQSTLPTDPFSYSFAGKPWGHKDLLADIVMYLGFDALGYVWFALLKGVVVLCVGVVVFLCGRRWHAADLGSVFIAGLAIVALQYRFVERPVLFSLAMFPLLIVFLERMRGACQSDGWSRPVRTVAPVVALLWLWSWLHREALVGIAFFALVVCGFIAARLIGRRSTHRPSKQFIGVSIVALGVAAALPLTTPSGENFYRSGWSVAFSQAMRTVVTDWARIGPLELIRDFPATAVLLLVALPACLRAILRARSFLQESAGTRIAHVVALIAVASAALADCVRWIPYTATLAAFVALRGLGDKRSSLESVVSRVARVPGAIALTIALLLAVAFWSNDFGTGVGPMPHRYPDGAAAFAQEHGLKDRVANAFHLGGYLIWKLWPETRVLIDGRNDVVYPPEFLLRAIQSESVEAVFRRLRAEDGATWVIAGNIPGQLTHSFLAGDPDWMLVYWSEPAVIYARRDAHPDLAKFEFKHIRPASVDSSVVEAFQRDRGSPRRIEELSAEVRRMLAASATGLRANVAAALFFHFRGSKFHSRRDAVLGNLDTLYPDHFAVEELRQRLAAQREAAPALRRAQ